MFLRRDSQVQMCQHRFFVVQFWSERSIYVLPKKNFENRKTKGENEGTSYLGEKRTRLEADPSLDNSRLNSEEKETRAWTKANDRVRVARLIVGYRANDNLATDNDTNRATKMCARVH